MRENIRVKEDRHCAMGPKASVMSQKNRAICASDLQIKNRSFSPKKRKAPANVPEIPKMRKMFAEPTE
jgi:hypothetical protein